MTRYDKFISASLDALAEWINEHGQFDDSPWMNWFDNTYCKKCESIILTHKEDFDKLGLEKWYSSQTVECAYCGVYHKCKYFPQYNDVISNCDIIKLWLQQEIEDE